MGGCPDLERTLITLLARAYLARIQTSVCRKEGRREAMLGKILIGVLAFAFGAAMPVGAFTNEGKDQAMVRDEDLVITSDDDEDDDGDRNALGAGTNTNTNTNSNSNGFTSGVNSNDKTNSRVTPVTRDRDRSRGDLTRDRTDDGPGPKKRDWTDNRTNDRTRRDSR
jgi:hypothetical protein